MADWWKDLTPEQNQRLGALIDSRVRLLGEYYGMAHDQCTVHISEENRAYVLGPEASAPEVVACFVGTCDRPAQPEHTPCCSSTLHGKALCCEHYCRSHFVEVDPCSPDSHAAAKAASVSIPKEA